MLTVVSVSALRRGRRFSGGPGDWWMPQPTRLATDGIGDYPDSWPNSYPWSMSMFQGDLYIGTGRVGCTSSVMSLRAGRWPVARALPLPGDFVPGNTPQAPPVSSFVSPDGTTVTDVAKYTAFNEASRAEIWRLHRGEWTRVWQAPLIDSYLAGAPKGSAAAILGLRGMSVMTDKHGVKALYAAAGGFSFALQQPLLMRSKDGVTWTRATLRRRWAARAGPSSRITARSTWASVRLDPQRGVAAVWRATTRPTRRAGRRSPTSRRSPYERQCTVVRHRSGRVPVQSNRSASEVGARRLTTVAR